MTQTTIEGKYYLLQVDEQLQNIAQLKSRSLALISDKPCNNCVSGGKE